MRSFNPVEGRHPLSPREVAILKHLHLRERRVGQGLLVAGQGRLRRRRGWGRLREEVSLTSRVAFGHHPETTLRLPFPYPYLGRGLGTPCPYLGPFTFAVAAAVTASSFDSAGIAFRAFTNHPLAITTSSPSALSAI